jgi:hypothetical protein
MRRATVAAFGVGAAVGAAIVGLVVLLTAPTRGTGPDSPPYAARAVAECFRDLDGNRDDGVIRARTHFVDGPGEFERDETSPVAGQWVRVEWFFDDDNARTTKVELFFTKNHSDAERLFADKLANLTQGFGNDGLQATRAAPHVQIQGNVVLAWDPGPHRTAEQDAQVLSCLKAA